MQEELGELSHAYLKSFQNIRGTKAEHEAEIQDAVGDIIIYLLDFCNKAEIDLEGAINETWKLVKKRDWQRYPKNGVSE